MCSGFQSIMWGIILLTFHINLGSIKILPAFIAWLIIVNGIKKLHENYEFQSFEKAKLYAILAVFLTLISELSTNKQVDEGFSIIVSILLSIACGIIELLVEYNILEGSVEYFNTTNNIEYSKAYHDKIRNYIIFFLIFLLLECFTISFAYVRSNWIVAIYGIILRIVFASMMGKFKHASTT